jgi:hypothetical protein
MANEFIARKGIISLDGAQVTGSLSVTGNISASIFSGSFVGDGSQLSGIEGFPFTGSAGITGSLTVVGPVNATTFTGDGSQLTGIEGFPFTGSARITGSLVVVGPVNATSFTGSLQGIATSASYVQLTNVDGFTAYSASINTAITPQTATVNTGSSPLTLTTQSIVVADSTNGNLTINLPDLNTIVGTPNQKPIVVYKNDYSQNVIYVNPSGSQLVNGASQDIIVSIQLAVIYNPTSAGWVTEGTSAQSLAELELFFLPLTETGSLATTGSNTFIGNQIVTGSLTVTGGINATITGSATSASYVEYTNVANKPALVSGSSQIFAGYDYEIHVSQVDGNDTTGDGSLLKPVASITKALTLTTAQRRVIVLHPGGYTENPTIPSGSITIQTTELTGGNTVLYGTLTIPTSGSGARISGFSMDNLAITGTAQAYVSNCTVNNNVVKSSSGYVEIINSEMQCISGIQISGAGTTIINGNKNVGIAVSNASAQVIIKGCNSVVTPSASAGNLAIVDCIVTALGGNGITITGASTTLTLLNSQVLVQAGNNVAPISVAGIYSIINTIYDKPGSTLTGTSTDSVDYFQYINADNITSTNGLTVTGSLTVTGQVVAQTLNVQQVTSSIVFSSGSNIFGNDLGNTQQFTGSVSVTGSLAVAGAGTFASSVTALGTATFLGQFGNGSIVDEKIIQFLRASSSTNIVNIQGVHAGVGAGNIALQASGGNVLIGTTTDNGARLQVNGAGGIRVNEDGSSTKIISIRSDFAGVDPAVNVVTNNSLLLMTSNTERMRITSGGNVLIGTTTDIGQLLQVAGYLTSVAGGVRTFMGYDGTGSLVGTTTNHYFRFITNDTERMRITSGGNVLIGTSTSNNHKLEIIGGATSGLRIDVNSGVSGIAMSPGAEFNIDQPGVGGGTFKINSSGNVGIGTATPGQKLEVVGGEIKAGRVDSSSEGGQVSFGRASDNATGWYIDVFGSTSTPALRFVDVSNSAVRMAINSSGNVGIGTDNPLKRLDVRASVAGEVAIISNDRNSTGDYAFVTSLGSNCNNTSAYHYIAATGGADRFYIYGNGTYTTVSDRRLKKDITKVTENYLDKVSRLNIVKYHWNEQSETDALEFGMIAQEVEELIPSIVQEGREDESGNKYKGIQSSVLPYILIKAIQELKAENDTLKSILQRNNIS